MAFLTYCLILHAYILSQKHNMFTSYQTITVFFIQTDLWTFLDCQYFRSLCCWKICIKRSFVDWIGFHSKGRKISLLTHRRLILSPRFHLGNGVNFLGVKHDLQHEQRHYRPLLHHIPLFLNCQHSGDRLSTFELGFQINVVVIRITMQILMP